MSDDLHPMRYGRATVEGYLELLAMIEDAKAWTGFAISPVMRGAGGAHVYLEEVDIPTGGAFALLKNHALDRFERHAKELRRALIALGVDETKLQAAEREARGLPPAGAGDESEAA
ncbi:MAG: hypothetical protein AB7P23_05675 [Amphiplicatus sp.]